jgi:hypothetical protein
MTSGDGHPEFSSQGGGQGRRPQGGVLTLAFVQPLPHRQVDGVGVAEAAIQERRPLATAGRILGLPLGQVSRRDGHIQLVTDGIKRFARRDPQQQLFQALRLIDYGRRIVHG